MELPKCPACYLHGIDTTMEYKKTHRNLKWFVCYKHTYPFFTTEHVEPQRTLDEWGNRGDALIVILAGIPL